jgi:hypothetical protein
VEQGSKARIELKASQEQALAAVRANGSQVLSRAQYEEITGVSRSQAAYDLAELVTAGLLERVGAGRTSRYQLVEPQSQRRRQWTNDRIRTSLEAFCAGRDSWPSARDFKSAGHADLYVAASRYGGIAFWTKELGFARPGRTNGARAARGPRLPRLRLRWIAEAAAVLLALAAAGASVLHPWATVQGSDGTPRQAAQRRAHEPATPKRASTVRAQVRGASKPQRHANVIRRSAPRSAGTGTNQLAAQRTQVAYHPATTTSVTHSATAQSQPQSTSGPAPLPAPSGPAAPNPIPPPGK